MQVIGPAPCFFNRMNGLYRWQIVLRGTDPAGLCVALTARLASGSRPAFFAIISCEQLALSS